MRSGGAQGIRGSGEVIRLRATRLRRDGSAYALRDSGATGPPMGRRSYAWWVTGGVFVKENSLVFWELRKGSKEGKMASWIFGRLIY